MHRPLVRVVVVASVLLCGLAARADDTRPLNVLFIISDDLTATALSCYGSEQSRTPHIDRLAARGVRFDRAYCQFPVCAASRAAIMASWYPQQTGVIGNTAPERFGQRLGDRPSMSQHFKNHGYFAARLGKIYHMGVPGQIAEGVHGPDHAASWTDRFSFKSPESQSTGHAEMLSRKTHQGSDFFVVATDTDGSEQHDPRAADKAIALTAEHKDKPFFLAVGFVRPHVPLVAPASYFDAYPAAEMQLAEAREGDLDDIPPAGHASWTEAGRGMIDPDKQRRALAAYYASVAFMDAQVGRLLDALDKLELTDRTVVVFCSDHGWHLGEHTFWQKMSLHEESARIPLIIAAPGIAPATRTALVEQIDIYPTLSELAGLQIPPHCAGKSLVGVMKDPAVKVRDAAYCLRRGHLLRTDRWAYMRYDGGDRELYDMHADPKQFTNLVGDADHKGTIAELDAMLDAKLDAIQSATPPSQRARPRRTPPD